MTNTRRFGRCRHKGCTTRLVLDPATDEHVRVDPKTGYVTAAVPPRTILNSVGFVGAGGDVYCATRHPVSGGLEYVAIKWAGVKATLNRTECDARCQNSRVEVCRCSCGGARHGETA